MGALDRFERRLERTVNGAFAKAFRSEVQPVEIASGMRRAMDNRATNARRDERPVVPNSFTVHLSPSDFTRLAVHHQPLRDELLAAAQEHLDTQAYVPAGPLAVSLAEDTDLETGVFTIRARSARQVDDVEAVVPADGSRPPAAGPARGERTAARRPAESLTPRELRARPWLDLGGETLALTGAITVIGRDETADLVLDDPGVSREHSEIRVTHDGPHVVMSVRDLGSTNGTWVNGDRVDRARVVDGDRITIGRTTMSIHLGGRR